MELGAPTLNLKMVKLFTSCPSFQMATIWPLCLFTHTAMPVGVRGGQKGGFEACQSFWLL